MPNYPAKSTPKAPPLNAKTALVLINLGSPDAPTPKAVRRYLREFLSDPRVVEIPRLIWWLILNVFVLTTRPKKSAEKYASIWLPEGSPLKVHSARQASLLRGLLSNGKNAQPVIVEYAMRYGKPALPEVLNKLSNAGCSRILFLPLYPQYAASTTASAFDVVFDWLRTRRNMPEIRTIKSYADHPGYIRALAASVHEHWKANGHPSRSYCLLMSFHGLPTYTRERGDPYYDECQTTGRLLAKALNLQESQYKISFQSRFGRTEWLKPYTATTLLELAEQGIDCVDVICPGFPADCLETLEEIAIEAKAIFLENGGKEYRYIACLNERDDWIATLAELAQTHLQGWNTQR